MTYEDLEDQRDKKFELFIQKRTEREMIEWLQRHAFNSEQEELVKACKEAFGVED